MIGTNPVVDGRRWLRRSSMETTVKALPRFTTRVGEREQGSGWAWPLTVVLHGLAAAAIVIVPLLGEESLPLENTAVARAFFVAPALAPVPPPPPPPPSAARPTTAPRVAPRDASSAFTAPVDVPESIVQESGLDLGVEGGVAGGVEGGVPGGVVGGVVGGLDAAPPPPPQVVRVGGIIREPKKVKHVPPVYPSIAIAAKIEGVVILECTINPQGRVEGVQVLRGVPTLDEAAVEAVKKWAYTPTLLGGVPVGVVMTVTVNFVLQQQTASN
jgi:protein TonB